MKNYLKFEPKVSKLDLKAQKLDLKAQKLDFSAFQLSGVGWICAQKKSLHMLRFPLIQRTLELESFFTLFKCVMPFNSARSGFFGGTNPANSSQLKCRKIEFLGFQIEFLGF